MRQKELAFKCHLSLGLVNKTVGKLEKAMAVEATRRGVRILSPARLLNLWAAERNVEGDIWQSFRLDPLSEVEQDLPRDTLITAFSAWSLLSRYFPKGCTVHRMYQPSSDYRMLVADAPLGSGRRAWSICLVNRGAKAVEIRIKLPGGDKQMVKRFVYSRDSVGGMDGYPSPAWTGEVDLGQELHIECPPEAVVVESSLPY